MTTFFVMICCAVLSSVPVAAAGSSGLRLHSSNHQAQAAASVVDDGAAGKVAGKEQVKSKSMLVKVPELEHQLVICNAYASPEKMEVVQVSTRQVVTEGEPLAYKHCKDFTLSLHEGEQLDFKAGGLDVGTFYATGLPKSAASLLLVPHRKSPHAVGCSFESHAFADVKSPQIAVIDVYRGKSDKQTAAVKIIETVAPAGDKAAERVEEELRFNSVVAVNPGNYNIALMGTDGSSITAAPLNAAGSVKYVVMRLGIEDDAQSGRNPNSERYPQELIVFPNGAMHLSVTLVTLIIAFVGLRDLM